MIGHRLRDRPGLLDGHLGYPVTDALEPFCLLGPGPSLADLVAAGDHLVREGVEDPLPILDALHATIRSFRRGKRRLERAAELVRPGVRSAMKSELRVVIVLAGLPEPEVNVPILRRDGSRLGEGDLLHRRKRQVLEHDGDGHRTDKKQFRKDLTRREEFEDEGCVVTRVTADDLLLHRRELLQRIARRLDLPFP